MDWLPTLLAAGSVAPDAAFAPDGINLLPVLTQNVAPIPRKLFWRYKSNAQRALRDGDYKYLKILDNTSLFNVVDDPMERANLKIRQKDDGSNRHTHPADTGLSAHYAGVTSDACQLWHSGARLGAPVPC